ncbi:MAG: hypothetical protein IPJ42_05780 [Betaproteobacteria bacterium]|nr:hypothetical protein [Betaproteobacteria bacterium]
MQIQQLIINLCLNAFDARDGQPAERRRAPGHRRHPRGRAARRERRRRRHPAAELPRIFESFYSTKRGGMGLGLAIVRSIVEAHGGTIRVARHDDGAEFLVVLPHPPATDSAPPPAGTHAA